jgi:hypothetical protein
MADLAHPRFDSEEYDHWGKSGRIPKPGEPTVKLWENKAYIDARIARGDKFAIATDPSTLPHPKKGWKKDTPNGYYTAWELNYLKEKGIPVIEMHNP